MKITEQEIRKMVQEAIENKLKHSSDFSARRQIIQAAQNASMEFENEMRSLLNLVNPDELPPPLQRKYLEIVEAMKDGVLVAVGEAMKKLATLPRNNDGVE